MLLLISSRYLEQNRTWIWSNSVQELGQHLLGTSVLVFLLLPLVFSCKSTKSKEEIYRDYTNIIQKQLNHINRSIQRQMESCREKRLPTLSSFERISSLSCNRFPKHINGQLQSELSNLTRNIHASLGCPCSTNQTEQALRWPDSQSVQKKFCRLKRLLMAIERAYERHNSLDEIRSE
ncbi:uncharacterized protein LOC121570485 isoform X1 [Tachysurus ichikawai]